MLYTNEQVNDILNLTAEQNSALKNALGVIDDKISLSSYAQPILNQPRIANEWTKSLLNFFAYEVQTKGKFFTSIFDYFREKRDNIPYGTYEVDVAPIMPIEYDMKAFDRDLTFWETETRAQYFTLNRQDIFPQTINHKTIEHIFDSYENFNDFLYQILIAPRRGNTLIENNAIKEIINKNFASGAISYTIIDAITKENAPEVAARIQEDVLNMTSAPTPDYNRYQQLANSKTPVYAQSERDDLVFMGTSKSIAVLRTYVLAFAFNKEDVDFNFHFVPVGKDFGYQIYNSETREFTGKQQSPIEFIICDGGFIKLQDKLDIAVEGPQSPMTLNIQHATHVWQTIDLRVFRNAIAYVNAEEMLYFPNPIEIYDNITKVNVRGDFLNLTDTIDNKTAPMRVTYGANGYEHVLPECLVNGQYQLSGHSAVDDIFEINGSGAKVTVQRNSKFDRTYYNSLLPEITDDYVEIGENDKIVVEITARSVVTEKNLGVVTLITKATV